MDKLQCLLHNPEQWGSPSERVVTKEIIPSSHTLLNEPNQPRRRQPKRLRSKFDPRSRIKKRRV